VQTHTKAATAAAGQAQEIHPTPPESPLLARYLRIQSDFADWVERTLSEETFDVCVARDTYSLEALRRTRDRTGCITVYDAIEYPDYAGRSGDFIRNAFLRDETARRELLEHDLSIARAADAVILNTPGLVSWYEERQIHPTVVRSCLPYVPAHRNDAIRAACGLKETDRLLVFVNSVFPGCGIDDIICALPLLPPHVYLAVSGSISPDYVATIDELRQPVRERVHLLPDCDPADLVAFRSGADLAVIPLAIDIPNHRTVLPNRVFEAVMSRVPLVSSDLPTIRSVLEEYGIGLCYEDPQPKIIARTIRQALERHQEMRIATERAAHILNWEGESQIYLDLIEPLVGEGPKHFVVMSRGLIRVNRRSAEQIRTLAEQGHRITALAKDRPVPSLMVPNCRYIAWEA
jgi:glycosyltransferase involved in cell wall biosynthesis